MNQTVGTPYIKMVSFLYAASHCTKVKGSATLTLDTIDLLEEATRKIFGKETNPIATGAESLLSSILAHGRSGGEKSKNEAFLFKDVKEAGGAVGSVPSLMFWTPEQHKILFEHHPRSVIFGQYGSGKTLLLTHKMKRMIQSDIDDPIYKDSQSQDKQGK